MLYFLRKRINRADEHAKKTAGYADFRYRESNRDASSSFS